MFLIIFFIAGESFCELARLIISARSIGTTLCLNFLISWSSLKIQVSKRSGRGPTSPILAPIKPREMAQTRKKSVTLFLKFSSSGKTMPANMNGICRRCSPEEMDNVPQKESDRRLPSAVNGPSFVPKSRIGLSRNAEATARAETSSPKVIVPIISPSIFFSLNKAITFSASPSSRTQPPLVSRSSGTMISSWGLRGKASRQRRRIFAAQSSSNGSRWAGTKPIFSGSISPLF